MAVIRTQFETLTHFSHLLYSQKSDGIAGHRGAWDRDELSVLHIQLYTCMAGFKG